jgi:hypothetical protein
MKTLSHILSICCIAILAILCGQMSKASASGLVDDYYLVDQRNPGAGINGLKSKEKAVVLIHGWNPEEKVNPLEEGEWEYLSGHLQAKLDRTSKDWAIVNFNWALSAATGSKLNFGKGASMAVINANNVGPSYARVFNVRCPEIRRVHFIAHSAGAWLARSAIIELVRLNPLVICELTLLDPAVPGRSSLVENYRPALLEEMTDPDFGRVWWAQNLYSDDVSTNIFTMGDMKWIGGFSTGQNFLVNAGGVTYNPYGTNIYNPSRVSGYNSNKFNWL